MARLVSIKQRLGGHEFFRFGLYGIIIGIVSGLGASLFFYGLEWLKYFTFEYLAGYEPAKPAGEHLVTLAASEVFKPWMLLVMPVIGGLISGFLVYRYAPEAEGHGTDALIDAFHNKKGYVRSRIPLIKGLASIVTLASGGSAGREGPIAQIGAGFGSWMAGVFKLSARERRLMLLAGCAAGLGAIFRAPLGGALTAIEILYREDFETEGTILCVIASVVGYSIFTSIYGHDPIFATPVIQFTHPAQLFFYALLGLACVPMGWYYVKTFYGMRDHFFRRIPIPKIFIPAIGGLMVGLVGLWHPEVLSGGYGIIQQSLQGNMPIMLMLTLAILKVLTTSFTISSGGSGGVFGPSLYIGAMLGGAVGQLSHQYYPEIVPFPGAFALVGMGGFFAGVAKAPVGALMMVCEMTGGYGLVVPLMFTSVIAVLLSKNWYLYEKQVENKFHSPAHRSDAVINVLATLRAGDVYNRDAPVASLPDDMTFGELKRFMTRTDQSFFPVVDDNHQLRGILSMPQLRPVLFDDAVSDLLVVGDLVSPAVSIEAADTLEDALARFLQVGYGQIPVTKEGQLIGTLSFEDLMSSYNREMQRIREE